ncbi:MAG: hypothetical protein B5M53_08665, partial [Candidatus Cloacimonas sp. 4484_209]
MNDKYKIIKTIATGGMATIYKAEQVSLSRPVIIKKLHPHLAADKELVLRFEREAKILGQLKHNNIVEIIDFFHIKNDYYIVLEYIDGESLQQIIKKKGALPIDIATYLVFEISKGLAAAHKNNILHRDVKPSNIMVAKDGAVKISDFGLALSLEGTEITEPGITIGTPAYLAPELLRGQKATPSSDIYSLGILFFEILTGKNPFRGKNRFETINNILYKKFPVMRLTNTEKEKAMTKLISRMTKSDPKSRYKSINEIIEELSDYISINQQDLAIFLSGTKKTKRTERKKPNTLQGNLVYSFLLILTILVATYIIVNRKKEMATGNKHITPFVITPKKTLTLTPKESKATTTHKKPGPTDKYELAKKENEKQKPETVTVMVNNKTNQYGYIKPVVKPWAKIYIDGNFYGNTPLANPIKLTAKKHTITFKHPNRQQYSETFNVTKGETTTLNIVLEEVFGYLKITVKPWAEILIDGEKKGVTPIANPIMLTAGQHLLELRKDKSILWHELIKI